MTLTLALAPRSAPRAIADPLTCNLADYKAMPGLTASVADDTLAVTWEGDNGAELRMRFAIDRGADRSASSPFERRAGNGARWRRT